jgi:hypothetical protein
LHGAESVTLDGLKWQVIAEVSDGGSLRVAGRRVRHESEIASGVANLEVSAELVNVQPFIARELLNNLATQVIHGDFLDK